MKHLYFYLSAAILLSGCVSLTTPEQADLRRLEAQGVTTTAPQSEWERPAKPLAAGALNLLPGFGNFYLAAGNGGVSGQYLIGAVNLALWPFSVLWGVPEAAIDAETINERELIWHYRLQKSEN